MAKAIKIPKKSTEIDTETVESSTYSTNMGPYADFYIRLKDSLIGGDIFKNIADWLCQNTMLGGQKFSFFEHEFQIAIASDPSEEGCIKKCSQVGLTELAIRIALAYLCISGNRSLIYVLPTSKFARKFATSRIDPVIEKSAKISDMLVTAVDGAEMKRFGDSFLYINGAANQDQAISVPAEGLFVDEYDFCDPTVLTTYNSRSRHAKTPFKRRWSTPTVDGYGIDLEYEESRQSRYLVKCNHCEKWAEPDFERDVHIPGFSEEFDKFDRDDLSNPAYSISSAYIACEHCGRSLDEAMADPKRRQWVEKFPTRAKAGWWVQPFDLISRNSTEKTLRQYSEYHRVQDYYNFVLGRSYTTKNAKFNEALLKKLTRLMEQAAQAGMCVGIDVGKMCYVIIGKKIDNKYHVTQIVKVRLAADNSLTKQLSELIKSVKASKIVIDAGPDFELVNNLKGIFGERLNPCVYVPDNNKISSYYEVSTQEKTEGVVSAQRTKGFDSLVEAANASKFVYPECEETHEFRTHLKGMKRVEITQPNGELAARWQKVGVDHYMHALFYFKLACDMIDSPEATKVIRAPAVISGVTLRKGADPFTDGPSMRAIASRFGVR